jgi:large subunit ribosomal protein L9
MIHALPKNLLTHSPTHLLPNPPMKTKHRKLKRTLTTPYRPLPKGERGGVELLLIHTVEHVGKQGQVVEVRPGYAYNYLIPHGLATMASDHHKRMVDKHKTRLMEIEKARLATLRQLAEAIAKQSVTIEANANDEGHLYGSVNVNEIAAALKAAGFHITTDQVRLEGVLKELGLYTVKIHLHAEIEAELKVWVVPTVTGDEKPADKPGEKAEKAEKKTDKRAEKPEKK